MTCNSNDMINQHKELGMNNRAYLNPNGEMHRMNNSYYYRNLNKPNDYGPDPFVVNIENAVLQNDFFRTALWTGLHMQLTLMSIKPGEDIGLEIHPNTDQLLRIEQGQGVVVMGNNKNNPDFKKRVRENFAILIPAGKWHNLINTGRIPLKLYSIYAPAQHPFGTVHVTKQDEEKHEKHNGK